MVLVELRNMQLKVDEIRLSSTSKGFGKVPKSIKTLFYLSTEVNFDRRSLHSESNPRSCNAMLASSLINIFTCSTYNTPKLIIVNYQEKGYHKSQDGEKEGNIINH